MVMEMSAMAESPVQSYAAARKDSLSRLIKRFSSSSLSIDSSPSMKAEAEAITVEQCDLIKASWKEVARPKNEKECNVIGLTLGMAFYDRLFELRPDYKMLFRNVIVQSVALVGMLDTVVNNIRKLAMIEAASFELGMRHYGYGVQPDMFGPVAEALLGMLEDRMGSEMFTDEVKEAWTAAYVFVSSNMIKGLKKAQKDKEGKRAMSTLTSKLSIGTRKASDASAGAGSPEVKRETAEAGEDDGKGDPMSFSAALASGPPTVSRTESSSSAGIVGHGMDAKSHTGLSAEPLDKGRRRSLRQKISSSLSNVVTRVKSRN